MIPLFIAIRHMTMVLMLTLLCGNSLTPAMAFEGDEAFLQRPPVNEAILDGLRGGFQSAPNGPIISFGIERSVFVNGQFVASTVLNIPDLMRASTDPRHGFTLIQTGAANAVIPDASSLPPLMTVIQNSLDNQRIQHQTVIDATVTGLGWTRSLAMGNALSQANLGAIRH